MKTVAKLLLTTCAFLSITPVLPAQTFYLNNSLSSGPTLPPYSFGLQGDIPLAGKFTNGGTVSYGIYRPSNQTFYLTFGLGVITTNDEITFGIPGDIPIVGDWNGDGITDVGVYRPSTLTFYLRYSATRTDTIFFGTIGDIPLVGDWNGDGIWSPGVYRPSNGTFYLTNTATSSVAPPVWQTTVFGVDGDKPIVGDWNGDGITTIGVIRYGGKWLLTNQYGPKFTSGAPDITPFYFGEAGDQFVAGDWDRNGTQTPGVFRTPVQYNPVLGTKLAIGCDLCVASQPIGFSFPFYGSSYSTIYVEASTGLISFAFPATIDPILGTSDFDFQPTIAPFFSYLANPTTLADPIGGVYVNAENPNELIITTYREQYYSYPFPDTFQVQLYSDGHIVMAYNGIGSFNYPALVGISPGSYAPLQGVNFNFQPNVDIPAGTGVYEYFSGASGNVPFNLDYRYITFTPDGSGGYQVRTY